MVFFLISNFIAKIKSDLQKGRVFLPEVLLGEILGNQIGKNAIFDVKKVFFLYQRTKFAVSAWIFDQKIPKNGQKEGRNSILLENSLS